jgi:hypothetical protein
MNLSIMNVLEKNEKNMCSDDGAEKGELQ